MFGSSLAEESSSFKLTAALENYAKELDETTTHHEYLIALLIIFLYESGFYTLPISDASSGKYKKTTYVPPKQWKSQEDDTYVIKFASKELPDVVCKLVAIPSGDRLILNVLSTTEKKVYSLAVQSLKYVNPFSSDLSGRYTNLKEISHRFKDTLVTRVRSDILTSAGLANPSLQGLPTELKLKILNMLGAHELTQISQCSRQFNELCKDPRLWKALLRREFPGEKTEPDKDYFKRYRAKHTERNTIRRQNSCCNVCGSNMGEPYVPWVHMAQIREYSLYRLHFPNNIFNPFPF